VQSECSFSGKLLLIALMSYSFARIGAAVSMRVEDYFIKGRRSWVRLHEKGVSV
jgi:hypothetical protein